MSADLLDTILTADIGSSPVGKRGATPYPANVKLCLMHIARMGGEVVTYAQLGDLIGASDATAYMAVGVLVRKGLVTGELWHSGTNKAWAGTVYTLNLPAIQALPRVARRATA